MAQEQLSVVERKCEFSTMFAPWYQVTVIGEVPENEQEITTGFPGVMDESLRVSMKIGGVPRSKKLDF